MKSFLYLIICILINIQWVQSRPDYSMKDMLQLAKSDDIKWLSIETLQNELKGKPPMNVGFDIDESVLFVWPVDNKIMTDHPNIPFENIPEVWEKYNCDYIKFTLPKVVGKALIDMHQERGDTIFFITARESAECIAKGEYSVANYLQESFSIKSMSPVIYVGKEGAKHTKEAEITKNNIKIYYGDSDGDIVSARKAGIEGIRLMRSAASLRESNSRIGFYGERVIVNSHY